MANKRMFDKKVVGSDKFLDLPNSSKALYFMAGMEADDKGFFQPKKIQKMCGFSDDDYKILIAKGYFIVFDSGVMVVTDWNKNNWLDSRRVTETEYVDELNMLKLINQKYEINIENNTAKQMLSENSIEENRIEENSIDKNRYIVGQVIDYLNEKINTKYKSTTNKTKQLINARINEGFSLEDFKKVIDNKYNDWFRDEKMSKYLRPETLFGTKFENYLNQKTKKRLTDEELIKMLEEEE